MKKLALSLLATAMWSSCYAENLALLVAVTEYPDKQQALEGPRNDALLIRDVLLDRGFAADKIHILADGVPGAGMPDRTAILSALDGLVKKTSKGDFVYLHFAGHGSQQPAKNSSGNFEPDGLDEIFLPIDIGRWDGQAGSVQNAITDDELGERITAIRNQGAFVWAVFDTCHSGTITRGAPTGERSRQVLPATLGIPSNALQAAIQAAKQAPEQTYTNPKLQDGAGSFVAFYAAQSDETAPEMALPKGSAHAKAHGLFSYTLAEAMSQAPAMSYGQLAQFVLARYASLARYTPTPLIEGSALNNAVLGGQSGNNQPQWPLTLKGGRLYLNAGLLHGVTPGSIMAILPTPIAPDSEALGYLQVTDAEATTSQAIPYAEKDKATIQLEAIKPGMYARLILPAINLTLRIAQPEDGAGQAHDLVRHAIAQLQAKPDGILIEWVKAGQDADLRLLIKNNQLWLLAADGQIVEAGKNKSLSIRLDKTVGVLKSLLSETVQRVAKTLNLKRLAAQPVKGLANDKVDIKLSIQHKGASDRQPLSRETLPTVHAGDKIILELDNRSNRALDVTVLYIDSQYGIDAFYPLPGETNRIEANARLEPIEIDINNETTGIESLALLAVQAEPQKPVADFRFLAQPQLDKTRGSTSDLEGLLMEAGFGDKTRGASPSKSPLGSSRIEVFNWRTE